MSDGLIDIQPTAVPEGDLRHWSLAIHAPSGGIAAGPDELAGQPEVRAGHPLVVHPAPRRLYRFEARVALPPGTDAMRHLRRLLLLGEPAPSATLSYGQEPAHAWHGTVEELSLQGPEAVVTIGAGYPNAGAALCRRVVEVSGGEDGVPAGWLPQVFGRGWVVPAQLFSVRWSTLAQDLLPEDGIAVLRDASAWPDEGRLQVADEVLDYTVINRPAGELGSTANPLARPEARLHRRGTPVALLPECALRWCAADHPAAIHEMRFLTSQAGTGAGLSPAVEALAGRQATVIAAERLPLETLHGTPSQSIRSGPRWQDWEIQPDTTAADPIDAVAVQEPGRGAVFSDARPWMRTIYTAGVPPAEHRFDRLLATRLRFEFSETPWWGQDTRLYVRVRKGTWEKTVLLNRSGNTAPHPVEGSAIVPGDGKEGPLLHVVRHPFETATTAGNWTAPENVISGNFLTPAILDGAGELQLGLRRQPLPRPGEPRSASFHAVVRNTSSQPREVTLRAGIPGEDPIQADFLLAADEESTLVLPLEDGEAELPEGWEGHLSIYTLEGEASLEAGEAWLEAAYEPEPSHLPPEEMPVPVDANVEMRLWYHPVSLDLTGMPGADSWEDFLSEPRPEVSFELLDPPPVEFWALYIRAMEWEWEALPATSVRPRDSFEALVHGRRASEDGTACPVGCVEEILLDPHLGNVPPEYVDEEAMAAAAGIAGERGLRVATVLRDASSIGTALERLLGEGCNTLVRHDALWRIAPAPLRVEGTVPLAVPPSLVHGTPHREQLRPPLPSGLREAISITSFLPDEEDEAPASTPRFGLRWLYKGIQVLRGHLMDRLAPSASGAEADLDAGLMSLAPGRVHSLPLPPPGAGSVVGELASVGMRDGVVHGTLAGVRPQETVFASGDGMVRWNRLSGDVRFFVLGRLVALLDGNGNLHLAGTVSVEATPALAGAGPLLYSEAEQALVIVEPASGTSILLGEDGSLLTPFEPIEEYEPAAKTLGDTPVRTDAGRLLVGGLDGGPPAMILSDQSLRFSGIVYTERILN